jgi:acetyl esterase/lipase
MFYRMNVNYAGSDDALKPGLAFPGGADLSGFPRSLVVNSSNDRLRKSGTRFAGELRDCGVEVSEHTLAGSHAFLNKPKSESFELGVNLAAEWILRSA